MPYTKVLKSARKLPLLAISHKAVLIPHRNAANAAESVLFQAKNTPIGNESWITIQKLANAQCIVTIYFDRTEHLTQEKSHVSPQIDA